MDEDSIFTKIIKGDIPSFKVYEDEYVYAVMDIQPIQPGQVLVIAKPQVDHFMDLPDDAYQGFFAAVKKIARKLRQQYPEKARVGVMVEGLEVAHAHAKVFPFSSDEEYRHRPDTNLKPDLEALAETAKTLYINR
jgi:histidine triad (HIT) family protein